MLLQELGQDGLEGPPVRGEVEQPSSEAGRPPRSPLTVVSCGWQDVGGTVLGISAWAVFPPGAGPSCDRVFFVSSISPVGLRVLWDRDKMELFLSAA